MLPGDKNEQLHKVMERREPDSAETLIIHVGTNDLRSTRYLDHIVVNCNFVRLFLNVIFNFDCCPCTFPNVWIDAEES